MEDSGDTQVKYKQFAQVTQAVTNVPKKITGHKSLTKHVFVSFNTCSFLLPSSILDCFIPDCWHDHKTPNTRSTGWFIFSWESKQKKAPLSGVDTLFLIFLLYDFVADCFSDGVVMSSCLKMFLLCQHDGLVL